MLNLHRSTAERRQAAGRRGCCNPGLSVGDASQGQSPPFRPPLFVPICRRAAHRLRQCSRVTNGGRRAGERRGTSTAAAPAAAAARNEWRAPPAGRRPGGSGGDGGVTAARPESTGRAPPAGTASRSGLSVSVTEDTARHGRAPPSQQTVHLCHTDTGGLSVIQQRHNTRQRYLTGVITAHIQTRDLLLEFDSAQCLIECCQNGHTVPRCLQ